MSDHIWVAVSTPKLGENLWSLTENRAQYIFVHFANEPSRNSCIAETMRRFPIDLYHINDYHGALAPLHLLPRTIPCCLSLHNAEFQGLWAIRNAIEMDEVCRTYNLAPDLVRQYVQFGEVFNLLHAGASYLRVWQNGFGAVGVSEKYGSRSFARYPIFWGLTKVGSLPNPDPSDLAEWDKKAPPKLTTIDSAFEAERTNFRCQVQEWAGLDVDPEAELFAFVGRWSIQKVSIIQKFEQTLYLASAQ